MIVATRKNTKKKVGRADRSTEAIIVSHGLSPEPVDSTTNTASASLVPPSVSTVTIQENKCPDCERTFATKIGLGVHRRSQHAATYHEEKLGQLKTSSRWSAIETARMAEVEATIKHEHPDAYNINQLIMEKFPNRPLESIKGKRRNSEYKALVVMQLAKLKRDHPSTTTDTTGDSEITDDSGSEQELTQTDGSEISEETASNQEHSGIDENINDSSFFIGSPRSESEDNSADNTVNYHWAHDYILQLAELDPTPTRTQEHLLDTALAISDELPEEAVSLTEKFLLTSISSKETPQRKKPRRQTKKIQAPVSKRRKRREDYAIQQKLFHKDRSRCYNALYNNCSFGDSLEPDTMFPFWENLLKDSIGIERNMEKLPKPSLKVSHSDLLQVISMEEINACKLPFTSAAGPDGVEVKDWNRISNREKAKLFSIWARTARVPSYITKSRTIFIPKKADSSSPEDARPISIASVALRHYHKILAKRLSTVLEPVFDKCQFGFRPKDGIAEAIAKLDEVFQTTIKKISPMALALIDLRKAFDSVNHYAIYQTMLNIGLEEKFITYIRRLYEEASTILCFKGQSSKPIIPKKGVRQGDPLSPLIFLLVFDNILRTIPNIEGIKTIQGNEKINHLAYADDLVLLSEDKTGLQKIFDHILPILKLTGLEINHDKSMSLIWLKDGKNKRTIFDNRPAITVRNRILPPMQINDNFKYLGVSFTAKGRNPIKVDLRDRLEILRKSALKPQQKLFFLVRYLLPSYYHQLTFAKIYANMLNKLDTLVRSFVRIILHLPKDTPKAMFHTSTLDGGLGIPSLRWTIPVLTFKRTGHSFTNLRTTHQNKILNSTNQVKSMWKNLLYATCDGAGLRGSSEVPISNSWILDGTNLMTGRNYIAAIQVRTNTLFSKARRARGRSGADGRCSRGCAQPETLNHILQNCFATHNARIIRHNKIVDYIKRGATQRNFEVCVEPSFQLPTGNLKPDLLLTKDKIQIIADVQIVNDQFPLTTANNNKIAKYIPLQEHLGQETDIIGITLNWRGAISKDSANDLISKRILAKKDLKILTVKTLEADSLTHSIHQKMTSYRRRAKKGVG